MEEMAEIRLKAQGVEIVPAGFLYPGAGWISTCIQPGHGNVIRHKAIEAAVAIAQIEIVGILLGSRGSVSMLQRI
jgi:hypothetical protein